MNGQSNTSRLESLNNHFSPNLTASIEAEGPIVDGEYKYESLVDNNPDRTIKFDFFKKKGWGYNDTDFVWDSQKDAFKLIGNRYLYSGKHLPNIKGFFESKMGFKMENE